MDKAQIALQKFDAGFNCAQSVLFAWQPELNIDANLLLRMVAGFGAGMARNQEVCGAVSGGITALGIKYGLDDSASGDKEVVYRKVDQLMTEFAQNRGTYLCRELLPGVDLKTPAGQATMKERNYRNTVCKDCIANTISIMESIF